MNDYDDLLFYLEENKFIGGKELRASIHNDFVESLNIQTSFLDSIFSNIPVAIRLTCVIEDIHSVPLCPICGGYNKITRSVWTNDRYSIGFSKNCSYKCSANSEISKKAKKLTPEQYVERNKKSKKTVMKRYGVAHISQAPSVIKKRKETNLERYGVTCNLKTEETKEKIKETNLERYGVENANQSSIVREKSIQTSLERYGETSYLLTDEFKIKQKKAWGLYDGGHPMRDRRITDKIKMTSVAKYGKESPTQRHISDNSLGVLGDKKLLTDLYEEYGFISDVADYLNVHYSSVQRAMFALEIKANNNHMRSRMEIEVGEFVASLGVNFLENDRKIFGFECDIIVESHKLVIEYNGVYWHSAKFKEKKFHQDKSLKIIEEGFTPLHIWEDDWLDERKKKIIKSKIKSKLGLSFDRIFARKTTVGLIDYKIAHKIMDDNHIQGKTTASYWIGLTDANGDVVACMGMKKTKKPGVFDLVRYATSMSVVGGLSKCLKYFETTVEYEEIFTYAALDYSSGNLYEKTGFTKSHITVPSLWYVKGNTRYRRELFMKHKLNDRLDNFDSSLTEQENMIANGFLPLHDSGSIKYTKKPQLRG
jgi:very-short-patch-repair endonuclease